MLLVPVVFSFVAALVLFFPLRVYLQHLRCQLQQIQHERDYQRQQPDYRQLQHDYERRHQALMSQAISERVRCERLLDRMRRAALAR